MRRSKIIVTHALRDSNKPIGVVEYGVGRQLPGNVRQESPGPETLQAELERLRGYKHG